MVKSGAKLHPTAEPKGRQIEKWGKDHLNALNVPVAEFAMVLKQQVRCVVADETRGAGRLRL